MRIKRIEVCSIRIPYQRVFKIATATYTDQPFVIVKIETNDGIIGYGEACPAHEFTGETASTVAAVIKELIGPRIIGMDPFDIEKFFANLPDVAGAPGAKAAIDIAMHDLMGKITGKPLHKLIGGRTRDHFPVTGGATLATIEETLDKVRKDIEKKIQVLKIKVGEDPYRDAEKIKRIREVVGDKPFIRVDANQGWIKPSRAIRALKLMERYDIQLAEQPILAWDLDGLAEIRRKVDIPIMVDESVHTPQDVVRVVEKRAADIINIKLMKTGGIHNALKVAAIAEASGLEAYIGSMGETMIGRAANLHLAIALDIIKYGDIGAEHEEWGLADDVGTGMKEEIINNVRSIRAPDKPGLGVEVLEDKLKRYLVEEFMIK